MSQKQLSEILIIDFRINPFNKYGCVVMVNVVFRIMGEFLVCIILLCYDEKDKFLMCVSCIENVHCE